MTRRVASWLTPLLILLPAAFLRLHDLEAQSLWADEGNSVVQAGRGLADIALHAARDIHPPGYYWLLHAWTRLAGASEFALRFLSAMAGVLGAACLYAAGRLLFGATAGLAATLLLALNGFSIWYAQEARMYALLALWGAAALPAMSVTLARPRPSRALALALVNAAGLWTHYAWPFVMLAQGLVALLSLERATLRSGLSRRRLSAFAAAMIVALLLFLPWLSIALERVGAWPSTGEGVPLAQAAGATFARLAFGPGFDSLAPEWRGMAVASGAILLLAGAAPTRRATWRSSLPWLWALAPTALFLALGLYREANLKFLLPAQLGLALWAGRGVAWLWSCPAPLLRLLALAAGAALATGLALASLGHGSGFQRGDYRGLVADISDEAGVKDLIVLNAPNQLEVFGYYYRGAATVMPMPPGTGPVDEASLRRMRERVAEAQRVFALYWGERERDPQGVVERELNALTHEAGSQWYGDVRLVRHSVARDLPLRSDASVRFGEHVELTGHALNAARLAPGEALQLQLDWRTDALLSTRYKVFLQVLNDQGRLVAQQDGAPVGGLAPTSDWTPGETIVDRRALILPDEMAAGRHTIIIGLYTEGDAGRRLALGDSDYLVVGTLEITGEKR